MEGKESNLAILELALLPESDVQKLRKWAADNIRGGDGLVFEDSRLFIVFPSVKSSDLEHALNRLAPGARKLGADLLFRKRGDDELVDSLYRRSEALILPVFPRSER